MSGHYELMYQRINESVNQPNDISSSL